MSSDAKKNQAEYLRRVNRVMDHIQVNRAADLSLETLAGVAAFSPYHFHRIWKAMTGETLNEFVQRIRLEAAATSLLQHPQTEVLTIALDNGFSSASTFARAFKDRFGMSASEWRTGGYRAWQAARNLGQAESNPGKADRNGGQAPIVVKLQGLSTFGTTAATNLEDLMNTSEPRAVPANVSVATLPRYRVAYMRHVGPYGAGGGIPALWQNLVKWAAARDLWTADRVCIGIAYDDPSVTDPGRCRYDAGIVIDEGFVVDPSAGAVNVTTVGGGKVAQAAFKGTAHEIGRAWHDLCAWLPGSGYQPDDGPSIEVYRGEFLDAATGIFTCDVCLPIKPL